MSSPRGSFFCGERRATKKRTRIRLRNCIISAVVKKSKRVKSALIEKSKRVKSAMTEKSFCNKSEMMKKKKTEELGGEGEIRFGEGEDRGKKPRDSVSVLDRRPALLYDKKKHFSCGRVPHQSTENWCCVGRTVFFIGKTHGKCRKSGKGSS